VAALHKRGIAEAVRELVAWFRARKVQTALLNEQAAVLGLPQLGVERTQLAEASDLLISMGGDGTLLATARLGAPRARPVLGINLGGFGFLAAVPRAEMAEGLRKLMSGKLPMQSRMMLEAEVLRGGARAAAKIALNDIVVTKGAFSRLFRLRTSISGEAVSEFPADGMIVSTPTGCTGYSLSAGGPVMYPEVRALVVTPICAHTLSARPVIVPADRVVEISFPNLEGGGVFLSADGQEDLSLSRRDRVRVREAPFCAKLVGWDDARFYAKLRGKLGWGSQR
jgi:NAD+ kinase